MKEIYLDIMKKAFEAYSKEQVAKLLEENRANGITEHGFPRLTADLGILIANGKCREYKDMFVEMMDICCDGVTKVKAGNDFSVKELVFAIIEAEKHKSVPTEKLEEWKKMLKQINPYECYTVIAPSPDVPVSNWGAYNSASEFMREYMGWTDAEDFLNLQIPSQIISFDENGMYRDPNEPMLYDLATRCQFAVLLYFGYKGKYRNRVYDLIKKSGEITLKMQSPTGEIPFGGRSNQFLFNEAYAAIMFEFLASDCKKCGDEKTASVYKSAAKLAADSICMRMKETPVHHVKNHFPTKSKYGCEDYAYYDKYMITLASFIYMAYLFADDSIAPSEKCPAQKGGYIALTSKHFHKVFAACGGYQLEFDTAADFDYDASGLGRIHKCGNSGELCLSVPFSDNPHYLIDLKNDTPLSFCSVLKNNGEDVYFCDKNSSYVLVKNKACSENAEAWFEVINKNDLKVTEKYFVSENGVEICAEYDGAFRYAIPVFCFDGEKNTEITYNDSEILVKYNDEFCRFTTESKFIKTDKFYANRNGHYMCFFAEGCGEIKVKIEMGREKTCK